MKDDVKECVEVVEIGVQGFEGLIKVKIGYFITVLVIFSNLLETAKYDDKAFEPTRGCVEIKLIVGNTVMKLFLDAAFVEYDQEVGGDLHPHLSCGKTR